MQNHPVDPPEISDQMQVENFVVFFSFRGKHDSTLGGCIWSFWPYSLLSQTNFQAGKPLSLSELLQKDKKGSKRSRLFTNSYSHYLLSAFREHRSWNEQFAFLHELSGISSSGSAGWPWQPPLPKEAVDCKWAAVHCGSDSHSDRLPTSGLISVEWLAITEVISGRIQMADK